MHTSKQRKHKVCRVHGGTNLSNMIASSPAREQDHTWIEEENQIWKRCNELLHSDKRLTKFYVTSITIHIAVLALVTLSVSKHT